MAQKRKDWNGLISGFKASGLTDGSRAVSTKKEDPLSELQLREGVFFRFGESNELHCFYLLYFYYMPSPAKVKLCTESLQAPSPSPSVPPLPEGEALAGRVTFHWTPKARIWRKRAGLATEGSSFWTTHLVKLPLPWTAEHCCSRDIVLCSSSMNLTDMPKPPLDRGGGCARGADGEVSSTAASKPDRRITNTKNYHMTSRNIF